jgi:hypothetical protein
MLTSTVKIEMDRPYSALTGLFTGRHVDSDFYLSGVFVPPWYCCLADTSNARGWGFGEGIQMRVFLAGFAQVKAWRNVSDV